MINPTVKVFVNYLIRFTYQKQRAEMHGNAVRLLLSLPAYQNKMKNFFIKIPTVAYLSLYF